eukprot:jgi/Mesvir1/26896/Mv20625-RA.1
MAASAVQAISVVLQGVVIYLLMSGWQPLKQEKVEVLSTAPSTAASTAVSQAPPPTMLPELARLCVEAAGSATRSNCPAATIAPRTTSWLTRIHVDVRNFKAAETVVIAAAFRQLNGMVDQPVDAIARHYPYGYTVMNDWDMLWSAGGASSEALRKGLTPYQKVNHIPGWQNITVKSIMMHSIKNALGPTPHFLPRTFSLRTEQSQWHRVLQQSPPNKLWLVKKDTHLGTGIKLVTSEEGLSPEYGVQNRDELLKQGWKVTQEFIDNPCLINGRKFGFRLWAVITSLQPLRLYIHRRGLVLFSTDEYKPDGPVDEEVPLDSAAAPMYTPWEPPMVADAILGTRPGPAGAPKKPANPNWKKSLLTNSAENKQGAVWDIQEMANYFHKRGEGMPCCDSGPILSPPKGPQNPEAITGGGLCADAFLGAINGMHEATALTFLSGLHGARQHYYGNFRVPTGGTFMLFGMDFIVDENMKPWLMEANATPSTLAKVDLMYRTKVRMVTDIGTLVGMRTLKELQAVQRASLEAAEGKAAGGDDDKPSAASTTTSGSALARNASTTEPDAPAAKPPSQLALELGPYASSRSPLAASARWLSRALRGEIDPATAPFPLLTSCEDKRDRVLESLASLRRPACYDLGGASGTPFGPGRGNGTSGSGSTCMDLSVIADVEDEDVGKGEFMRLLPHPLPWVLTRPPKEGEEKLDVLDGSGCRTTGASNKGAKVPQWRVALLAHLMDVPRWSPRVPRAWEDRLLWQWEALSALSLHEKEVPVAHAAYGPDAGEKDGWGGQGCLLMLVADLMGKAVTCAKAMK